MRFVEDDVFKIDFKVPYVDIFYLKNLKIQESLLQKMNINLTLINYLLALGL